MKVATDTELQSSARRYVQLSKHGFVALAVVSELVVAVWRGHNVSDAVIGGDSAHLPGHLPRAGAVVDVGKNMAVDVEHSCVGTNSVSMQEGSVLPGVPWDCLEQNLCRCSSATLALELVQNIEQANPSAATDETL